MSSATDCDELAHFLYASLQGAILPGFWSAQGDKATAAPLLWLWHGYLAAGNVTVLTSQWKSGQTTLLAVLLARMATGGQLARLPVKAARAVVISEECHLRKDEAMGQDGHTCIASAETSRNSFSVAPLAD